MFQMIRRFEPLLRMGRIGALSLVVCVLSALGAEARVGGEKIPRVFQYVYHNEVLSIAQGAMRANYVAYRCPLNIHRLLVRLQEAGVDLAGMEVYYLMGSIEPDPRTGYYRLIRPVVPRAAMDAYWSGEWTFHVVLRVDDHILDLDFTASPRIVPVDQYFGEMWGLGPKAWPNLPHPLWLRSIPGEDYLRDYNDDYIRYLYDGRGQYPAERVEDLMGW